MSNLLLTSGTHIPPTNPGYSPVESPVGQPELVSTKEAKEGGFLDTLENVGAFYKRYWGTVFHILTGQKEKWQEDMGVIKDNVVEPIAEAYNSPKTTMFLVTVLALIFGLIYMRKKVS